MQKLIVLGIIVMMITGCSVAANAYAGVALNLAPVADVGSFHSVQVGWLTDVTPGSTGGAATTDGKDSDWDLQDTQAAPAGTIEMDIVNAVIASSKVTNDMRAPLLAKPDFKIWRLKTIVVNPNIDDEYLGASIGLAAAFQTGFAATNQAFYIFNAQYSTQAQCTAAIGTGTQLAKLTSTNTSYTSAAGAFSIAAPVFNEEEGTWSVPSKYFTVYCEQIPEPGSLLALFSGVIGLVGFGIRRRK